MNHIHFCITVLLCLGGLYLLTSEPAVGLMFSLLTLSFTCAYIYHYS
jgi:hypothetical protein